MVRALAGISDPGDVADAIADASGVSGGTDVLGRLVSALDRSAGLLLLDNCEHVLDGVTVAVDALLSGCPQLTVLATVGRRST